MKLSYNWLKQYIDLDLSPSQLCGVLSEIGLEVGSMEPVESIRGGLEGLVIGEVIECRPHPGSDHLHITRVDTGGGELLPIVCGAPNVAAGQKVVVATPGATLYTPSGELTIKKVKIRGEFSEGMICSELETGLGSDGDGIMVLPSGAETGRKAADYFNIEKDWVIEADITPNRIECASYLGVARELAAALARSGPASWHKPSVEAFRAHTRDLVIPVEVLNPEACPRYSAVTLTGLSVGESPRWLQERLRSIGLTPINNVVDVTNFVLFETGQPLHAFDADAIAGKKVLVRTLPAGTLFTTLDGTQRKLDPSDLMICNAEEGMCIGGVFGGIASGVRSATRNVFLESACFDPVYIRKTSRRHGLYTDASFRFERGTDINGTLYALKRAALLIMELAGGTVSSGISDFYPNPVDGFPVDITYYNVNRLIGKELERTTVREILLSLGYTLLSENDRGLSVLVPASRVDVRRECDVIEDILRIYGYNNVEIPTHVNASLGYSEYPDPQRVRNLVADQLAGQGFHEIWSNSLTRASYYENLRQLKAENTVRIYNPLSSDLNGMRQTLLFGGLECIAHNANRKNFDLKLFEFGNCYFRHATRFKENPVSNYGEEEQLALFMTGNREQPNWLTSAQPASLFLLKGYVEKILERLGYEPDRLMADESGNELFDYGIRLSQGDRQLADLGCVAAPLLKDAGIELPVFYAALNWSQLLMAASRNSVKFSDLPKYPEVRRDLALVLDREITFQTLRELAFRTERQLLRAVDLFDIYEGSGVPAGKKSYAISFILRDDHKTLNDKVIAKSMERLLGAFEKETGARLR